MRHRVGRAAVGWLEVALGGLLLASAACGSSDSAGSQVQPGCSEGLTACGAQCVNLEKNPAYCGSCGTACEPSQMCSRRQCLQGCATGLTNCDGACANLAKDRDDCGACGVKCASGMVCSAGECSLSCQSGLDNCGGECTNVLTDRNHCGGCGSPCPQGTVCSQGQCASTCGSQSECDGSCVDLQTDLVNCGACGVICARGQVCAAGTCVPTCASGTLLCGTTCANPQNDNLNCGSCGHACEAWLKCVGGSCTTACGPELTDCAGSCVDTSIDPDHCGGCDSSCTTSVPNGAPVCVTSKCRWACQYGWDNCDDLSANGCEKSTLMDPANCGGCGVVCQDTSCWGGVCGKLAFVSSEVYTGDLGGLSGADDKCQQLAQTAGRAGVFKAWLSDETTSAADRLAHATVPYVLLDGTVIANNWSDLVDGTLDAPFGLTEYGLEPSLTSNLGCNSYDVMTATNWNGARLGAQETCSNWTSTGGNKSVGYWKSTTGSWTTYCAGPSCDVAAHLYCLEQ